MNDDPEDVLEEIEQEYLQLLHGLMTRTILRCQQEDIDRMTTIRIIFMNTLYMLIDYSGALTMPRSIFMKMVDRAYETVEDVQERMREQVH